MFSVLLIGTNTAYIKQQALEICKKEGIDPFDITTIATASSLGIEDVREVQKLLFLQPLRGTKKAIIIEKSHMATIEAQNALLKTLEEPPLSTVIILLAETEHTLLPTILSRCTIFTYK